MTTQDKTIASGIPFDTNFKFPKDIVTFEASSFQQWVDQALPQLNDFVPCTADNLEGNVIDIGRYKLRKIHFPVEQTVVPGLLSWRTKPYVERTRLKMFQSGKLAYCNFDDAVDIPVLSNALNIKEVWMSLTPMEVASCRSGIKAAKGDVVLGGMGMGWMAREILKRQQVKKLTIVEHDKDILNYFGSELEVQHGERVELVHADIWKYLDIHGSSQQLEFDSYVIDIWQSYGTAYIAEPFVELKRLCKASGKRCWGWGDVAKMPR